MTEQENNNSKQQEVAARIEKIQRIAETASYSEPSGETRSE